MNDHIYFLTIKLQDTWTPTEFDAFLRWFGYLIVILIAIILIVIEIYILYRFLYLYLCIGSYLVIQKLKLKI